MDLANVATKQLLSSQFAAHLLLYHDWNSKRRVDVTNSPKQIIINVFIPMVPEK